MYASSIRSGLTAEFWASFGRYMAPVPPAGAQPVNWVNYKTGIKDIRFLLRADTHHARIAVCFLHSDTEKQHRFFSFFKQFETAFAETTGEQWDWEVNVPGERQATVSCVSRTLIPVNILARSDWPAIISFFKPRLIALDAFWEEIKPAFELL